MDVISRKIEDLVKDGWDYGNWDGFWDWAVRVRAFLRRPPGEETAEEFWGVISTDDVRADHELWTTHRQEAIGMLRALSRSVPEFEQLSSSSMGGSTRATANGQKTGTR